MMNTLFWIACVGAAIGQCLGEAIPQGKGPSKTKHGGGRKGFYSSRFGSVYQAQDFVEQPTTVEPAHLAAVQVPTGVAAPHQQNIDAEINSEVPNIEEHTFPNLPIFSDDLRLGVKGGIKGGDDLRSGVKGGIKGGDDLRSGVKGGIKGGDDLRSGVKGGIKGGKLTTFDDSYIHPSTFAPENPIRITVLPNGEDVIVTTPSDIESENLRRKTKKGIKGGKKGYQYDVNIKALFSDPTTPYPTTIMNSYNPQILNLPTERQLQAQTVVPTTENYRQETVAPIQQTELPVYQLTEEPIQQTELPIQQTELPIQQTELPIQQTELPVQQTELPVQQTELPVQQTELPYQQTELPVQSTQRETEYTTTWRPTTVPYEPVQSTQSPYEPVQSTQRPEYPTTILDDQQLIQEPLYSTQQPIYTTQVPTTVRADEFAGYPLGMEGRHQLKGAPGGKGKGAKGAKGAKGGLKSTPKSHISVESRGSSGVSGRRVSTGRVDPGTPLLPSLRG